MEFIQLRTQAFYGHTCPKIILVARHSCTFVSSVAPLMPLLSWETELNVCMSQEIPRDLVRRLMTISPAVPLVP